jgi:hypothetical protein
MWWCCTTEYITQSPTQLPASQRIISMVRGNSLLFGAHLLVQMTQRHAEVLRMALAVLFVHMVVRSASNTAAQKCDECPSGGKIKQRYG